MHAIDSVLGQSFTDLELIVVDDGSTDGSADVIRRHLAGRAPAVAVRFVHRPNRGLCHTINEGLSIARGKYVALLASDDTWEADKLARQVAVLEEEPASAACYSDYWAIDASGLRVGSSQEVYPFRGGDIYMDLVDMRFIPLSSATLFRRDVLLEVGGLDEALRITEDLSLWLKVAKDRPVAYIPERLASYRMHEENASKRIPEALRDDWRSTFAALLELDPSLEPMRSEIFARIQARYAGLLYNSGRVGEARAAAARALLLSPRERLAWTVFTRGCLGARLVMLLRRCSSSLRARRFAASSGASGSMVEEGSDTSFGPRALSSLTPGEGEAR
jgi:glycosyltransferase involved in cell wall biosynthesis